MKEKVVIASTALTAVRHVGKKERLAFYISAFFRDMSYALMGFLSYFYIDIMGLSGLGLSVIMVMMRIWDGINDPLMGVYFDRRKYTTEKARPFFKRTAVPGAILIIFMFFSPAFSKNPEVNMIIRLAYAFVTYCIFEALQTLNGTSYMSLYNSISPNVEERSGIISIARLFSTAGTGIIGGVIPILLSFFANDNIKAKSAVYFGVAVFVGVCFLIYNILMYKYVRERALVDAPKEKQRIGLMFKNFAKNKLLLLMMASNAVAGIVNPGNTSLWFYTYNMGNAALATLAGVVAIPALLLGSFLVPFLVKRIDKKTIVLISAAASIAFNVLYLLVGYEQLWFVLLIAFLVGIPNNMRAVLYWNMISDSVDYSEWKTGVRNDGMIYSIEGFLGKIVGAIGTVSTVIIVAVIKFVPNAPTQSRETMAGLFYVPLYIQIASTALSTIPYFFYNFSRSQQKQVIEDLHTRKNEIEIAAPTLSEQDFYGIY